MALEIERKFLVVDQSFKGTATSVVDMRQGYLSRDADAVVRVRIAGDRAFLTVKTRNRGCVRNEFDMRCLSLMLTQCSRHAVDW